MGKTTKRQFCGAVAKSLNEFGYSGITAEMIAEILDAWLDGKRGLGELPHGVIGAFAERQFDEAAEAGADLSVFRDEAV